MQGPGFNPESILEHSPDTIMRFDMEFRHLYCSPSVEKYTGIPAQAFIGKTHEELGFPEDICHMAFKALKETLDTKGPHRVEFVLPNGIWIDWYLVPEFTRSGVIQSVLTYAREITDRKHTEERSQELIRRHKLIPPDTIEGRPYPVKISTLGGFEVLLNGKELSSSRKVQRKPIELLKALIALGGRDVAEEQLTDILWPESEGDAAHKSHEITLIRLRRLIGNGKAIRFKNRLVTLDPQYCWVDVWAFEQLAAEVDAVLGSLPQEKGQALALAEKAISLYSGDFLPADTWQSWLRPMREHLRLKHTTVILKAGRQYEEAGQWEKAVECFQKGINTDHFAEEFYQRLMVCYRQLGQETDAIATYNRCCSMLSATLGVSPSSRTEEIYKTLRKDL